MTRVLLTLLATWTIVGAVVEPPSADAQILLSPPLLLSNKPKVDSNALREMLNKGLRTSRDDEKSYVDWIVRLVAKEKLPVSLVYASFKYARTRRPSYPFPYFVFSVETLAKRNNIDLTDDDDDEGT